MNCNSNYFPHPAPLLRAERENDIPLSLRRQLLSSNLPLQGNVSPYSPLPLQGKLSLYSTLLSLCKEED
jgi:hypothetical protein